MNKHPNYLLNQINGPKDVKQFTISQLKQIAEEIRTLIVERTAAIGGHTAPNLGITEVAVAFHYVFNSPTDKIIWDVSHQSYAHKCLTGRVKGFIDPDHYADVGGFTDPNESEHDFFAVGHTSTSVSLAVGMAQARDLQKQSGNIVAVLGDGSASGGLAFEGLNNAGRMRSNLIVIFNDNQMSIDENQGGLYQGLKELRETNGQSTNNIFKFMGFDYRYVADGNDLDSLINVFNEIKDIDHPIVIHINTLKGKGYKFAEQNKFKFHWSSPFDIETGQSINNNFSDDTYDQAVIDVLSEEIENDQPIMAINAAIPGTFGLKKLENKYPHNYLDVGIAEQHSLTMAAGMAKNGAKPVVFHNSTFLQRAYDQLSHDIALNDLPVVILIKNGTISQSSWTHQGDFDIPYITSLPNIEYLAPTNEEELQNMLRWALRQNNHPIAIREPMHNVEHGKSQSEFNDINYRIEKSGEKVAILALGDFYQLGEQSVQEINNVLHFNPTLINPISASNLDENALDSLLLNHQLIITLEDGSLSGGFGEKIDRYFSDKDVKVLNYGAKKEFNNNIPVSDLYRKYHLTPKQIVDDIKKQNI